MLNVLFLWGLITYIGHSEVYHVFISPKLKKLKKEESLPFNPSCAADFVYQWYLLALSSMGTGVNPGINHFSAKYFKKCIKSLHFFQGLIYHWVALKLIQMFLTDMCALARPAQAKIQMLTTSSRIVTILLKSVLKSLGLYQTCKLFLRE